VSDPWAELEKKYGGGAVTVAPNADPWAELEAKYAPQKAAPTKQAPEQPQKREGNMLTNLAQGFNRGAIQALGLPVDTVLNVADLATAGYGAIKGALGGKDLPDTINREDIPGSSEWMLKKVRAATPVIADPADPGSFAAAAGQGIGGSLPFAGMSANGPGLVKNAITNRQLAANAAMGAASGVGGKIGGDIGGPQGAILGGMLPQAGLSASQAIARGAIRGTSPEQMQTNIQALKDAGVDSPTVGLATGNGRTQWLEGLLSKLPISGNIMKNAGEKIQDQLAAKVGQVRDSVSPTYGNVEAGNAIVRGIDAFKDAKQATANSLYGQIDSGIPWHSQFPMDATAAKLKQLTTPLVGAPGITDYLGIGKGSIGSMRNAVQNDLMANRYGDAQSGVPFPAIKALRSDVGESIPGQILTKDKQLGQYKSIYGALSEDLKGAAATAGKSQEFNRANTFYNGFTGRLEDLQPFYNKASPEQTYKTFQSAANNAGTTAQTVLKSLPVEQRKVVVASMIDELGKANPGAQNAEGNVFSSQTFLTNWNKMDGRAKSALLAGEDLGLRVSLDKVAKAAEQLKKSSSVLANPSGSGTLIANASGASAAAGAVASMNPVAMTTAAAALAVPALSAKLMTSPKFVNWLAQSTTVSTPRAQQHLARLASIAANEPDPERRQAMLNYAAEFNQRLQPEKQ